MKQDDDLAATRELVQRVKDFQIEREQKKKPQPEPSLV
jgi:hypothetical protein